VSPHQIAVCATAAKVKLGISAHCPGAGSPTASFTAGSKPMVALQIVLQAPFPPKKRSSIFSRTAY
jgi:hypothetical protein